MRVQQNGLELRACRRDPLRRVPGGIGRRAVPGARRAPSAQVALLVNRGERGTSYVMPDLIGVNGDRAADLLRAKGFRVAVVGEHPYPGVPAGIVLRQRPDGGFQIAPGEPISLEVSR